MSESIEIQTSGPLKGSVRPPGSKSITNRALVCAALAEGTSKLTGALESEDTRVMIRGLEQLGISIKTDWQADTVVVTGCDGEPPAGGAQISVANSGTTARFLTAAATLGHGTFRIDGVARMRQRPIGDLIEALRQLGADVASQLDNDCPPVIIKADGLPGGKATVRGDISSQFLSGLLLVAPAARQQVEINVSGPLVSEPYIDMTLRVMSAFGALVGGSEESDHFFIPAGMPYRGCDYQIEPDASAASYFFAAAAITGGQVSVEGLSRRSIQGDVAFCDCLARMGCEVRYEEDRIIVAGGKLAGIDVDMNGTSDTVQTLSAVALFADGPTTITGVGHIRHKETDRIAALATELGKLGASVDERPDGLRIEPGRVRAAHIDTYDDHRMAMSMSLVGLSVAGVVINDPGCSAKTYPNFFADLAKLQQSNS